MTTCLDAQLQAGTPLGRAFLGLFATADAKMLNCRPVGLEPDYWIYIPADASSLILYDAWGPPTASRPVYIHFSRS